MGLTINTNAAFNSYEAALNEITRLKVENKRLKDALEMFSNRRKLALSLRNESPHVYAFVEAIGCEIDKIRHNPPAHEGETDK